MGRTRRRFWPAFAGLLVVASAVIASTNPQKWAGSRTSPVHQIPLKDELDQLIVPSESNPLPLSSRYSCAPCHDYDIIKGGWHFNAMNPAPAGRPGEPWVWLDERTGTQIPLSYRAWKNVWNPKDLGLSAWDFVLLFGRHFPGGGPAEPADEDMTPGSRWSVAGKIEINCMGCHNASSKQNPSEWARQVLRENFRWAATAAAGLGEVNGMSSRLRPTWDLYDGPNPDDSEWAVAPSIKYDRALFDSKHKAFLDIAYKADDARCLACHSTAPMASSKRDFEDDAHTASGIKCVNCHRNDISHAMVRGYEGEGRDNPAAASGDFTCRGCHLGGKNEEGKSVTPGRLGAPRPIHKGYPAVHFDRMSCTVCHSGPLPAKNLTRVRTARANRLGIFGVADWSTDLPAIVEPVYLRDARKKLTPHRLMWPAFWARIEGKAARPINPAEVAAAAGEILYPEKAPVGVLNALAGVPDLDAVPVLVADGGVFEVNIDGGLTVTGETGTPAKSGVMLKKGGQILPLLPSFDPANAEAAADPEAKIQGFLTALAAVPGAPGVPAAVHKNVLYRLAEGVLEKGERKGTPAAEVEWVWLKSGQEVPLIPAFSLRTLSALAGSDRTLTEEQVELVLRALSAADKKPTAYISGGRLFRLGAEGKLESRDHDAAAPVSWPLAHQVRPARQSLGVNGCTDCHSADSAFFFAGVRGAGPLKTEKVETRTAVSTMGMTGIFHRLFGLSFLVRPGFKAVLGIAAFVIASLLAIVLLISLGRAAGLIERRR